MKWYMLQCAPLYLCMQLKSACYEHSIKADRAGKLVFTDIWPATSHLTAVHWCSTEAPRHLYRFRTRLTRACCWGEVERTSQKSLVWCARKDVLRLNKPNSCQDKRDRGSSCEWGDQPLPRPSINGVKYF